jgi:hypothetical protein
MSGAVFITTLLPHKVRAPPGRGSPPGSVGFGGFAGNFGGKIDPQIYLYVLVTALGVRKGTALN